VDENGFEARRVRRVCREVRVTGRGMSRMGSSERSSGKSRINQGWLKLRPWKE
jgi:hypothetical protein